MKFCTVSTNLFIYIFIFIFLLVLTIYNDFDTLLKTVYSIICFVFETIIPSYISIYLYSDYHIINEIKYNVSIGRRKIIIIIYVP